MAEVGSRLFQERENRSWPTGQFRGDLGKGGDGIGGVQQLLSAFSLQPHTPPGTLVHRDGWESLIPVWIGPVCAGYTGKRVLCGMLSRYLLHPQTTSAPRPHPAAGTTATSSACTGSRLTQPSP